VAHYRIVRWNDNTVICEGEASSLADLIVCRNREGISFADAYLTKAYLAGSNLAGANLEGADLADADLTGANLAGANLAGAILAGADLAEANLAGADLAGADLRLSDLAGANFTGAILAGANFTGANLAFANLAGSNLAFANLAGSNLTEADLARSNLTKADLTRANFRRADLTAIRDDFFAVLSTARDEVAAVRAAVEAGKIDGELYVGDYACLIGTIANARGCSYDAMDDLPDNARRPAERWFLGLRPGDTPDRSQIAAITLEWIDEWLDVN
jgi:uncharacterized protein YjbI with pentapeptide repeats